MGYRCECGEKMDLIEMNECLVPPDFEMDRGELCIKSRVPFALEANGWRKRYSNYHIRPLFADEVFKSASRHCLNRLFCRSCIRSRRV